MKTFSDGVNAHEFRSFSTSPPFTKSHQWNANEAKWIQNASRQLRALVSREELQFCRIKLTFCGRRKIQWKMQKHSHNNLFSLRHQFSFNFLSKNFLIVKCTLEVLEIIIFYSFSIPWKRGIKKESNENQSPERNDSTEKFSLSPLRNNNEKKKHPRKQAMEPRQAEL